MTDEDEPNLNPKANFPPDMVQTLNLTITARRMVGKISNLFPPQTQAIYDEMFKIIAWELMDLEKEVKTRQSK